MEPRHEYSTVQFASGHKKIKDLPSRYVDFSFRDRFDANKQTGSRFENLHGFVGHNIAKALLTVHARAFAHIAHL